MAFAITANFLLGTYQGSDSGGRPEPYPSPDRLYKACVAAAYNTFDFERQTDDRVLTDEQIDYVPKETEGLAGYRPPFVHSERALEAPWTRAIVMSVTVDEGHQGEKSEWKPSESEYVGWAVALHRFLNLEGGKPLLIAPINDMVSGESPIWKHS